jgi:hypothetical protein
LSSIEGKFIGVKRLYAGYLIIKGKEEKAMGKERKGVGIQVGLYSMLDKAIYVHHLRGPGTYSTH